MEMTILPLGAGQDIGRSCIIVTAGGVRIMLDCGVHMGHRDDSRRFPDFGALGGPEGINKQVQAVVITHFHLDHIGALPYLTEIVGYRGPIVMTHATRALAPLMLEDFQRVLANRSGPGCKVRYTADQIRRSLERVTPVALDAPLALPGNIMLTAHYAGHVLGAAMFHVRAGAADVLYTGDYNMTADRHLGAARVPALRPDVLITESTYATTIRESRRGRERKFLDAVLHTVRGGGKVLVPVFALGNAQELSILIDDFWERMGLQVPIYMSEGMAARAAALFEALTDWASQKLRGDAAAGRNPFRSPRFQPWRPDLTDAPGPCVLLATPGMLHGGTSLAVFKAWAPHKDNLVVLPSYCVAGTVGHMLASGLGNKGKVIHLDGRTPLHVKCRVEYMAFSAHTDARGVMDLIQQVQPRAVVLVHGEPAKMAFMRAHIQKSLNLPCHCPENGAPLAVGLPAALPVLLSEDCMRSALAAAGRGATRALVAAVAQDGADGAAALALLLENLPRSEGLQSPATSEHAPAAADASAVLARLAGAEACCLGDDVSLPGRLVAEQLHDGTKRMHLLSADESAGLLDAPPHDLASRSGAARSGAARSGAVVKEFVQFAAECTARCLAASGHGTVDVRGEGNVVQAGSLQARLIPHPAQLCGAADMRDDYGAGGCADNAGMCRRERGYGVNGAGGAGRDVAGLRAAGKGMDEEMQRVEGGKGGAGTDGGDDGLRDMKRVGFGRANVRYRWEVSGGADPELTLMVCEELMNLVPRHA